MTIMMQIEPTGVSIDVNHPLIKLEMAAVGTAGKSAYEIAVSHGFTGTEEEWLASLDGGDTGGTGVDGLSAYEVALVNGFAGTVEEWLASLVGQQGEQGIQGEAGAAGTDGLDGQDGTSAYETWLSLGNFGSEADFIASLKGNKGDTGAQGIQGIQGEQGLQGEQGAQGIAGSDGSDGASAYEIALSNGFVGTEVEWLTSLKGADGAGGSAYSYHAGSGTVLWCLDVVDSGGATVSANIKPCLIELLEETIISGLSIKTGATAPACNCRIAIAQIKDDGGIGDIIAQTADTDITTIGTYAQVDILLPDNVAVLAGLYYGIAVFNTTTGTVYGTSGVQSLTKLGQRTNSPVKLHNTSYRFGMRYVTYGEIIGNVLLTAAGGSSVPAVGVIVA